MSKLTKHHVAALLMWVMCFHQHIALRIYEASGTELYMCTPCNVQTSCTSLLLDSSCSFWAKGLTTPSPSFYEIDGNLPSPLTTHHPNTPELISSNCDLESMDRHFPTSASQLSQSSSSHHSYHSIWRSR